MTDDLQDIDLNALSDDELSSRCTTTSTTA